MALSSMAQIVMILWLLCVAFSNSNVVVGDSDYFVGFDIDQVGLQHVDTLSVTRRLDCLQVCSDGSDCLACKFLDGECSLYGGTTILPQSLSQNSNYMWKVNYTALHEAYRCLGGIRLQASVSGTSQMVTVNSVTSYSACFRSCILVYLSNCQMFTYSEVDRKCTMTSADFYESWVSHEEETEAVSCYYHISDKFKPMYLYPNRFGNSYTNQVTGPWMDTTFSNYPTVDIDTLLLNNTEGMLKSSLVNAWQYMNIDKVKVSVYNEMIENKTYVFNGSSTTLLTWFTSSRLLESPYTDLTSNPAPFHLDWWLNYDGSSTQLTCRGMYLAQGHFGCHNDWVWLLLTQNMVDSVCDYEKDLTVLPLLRYSPASTAVNAYDLEEADQLVISVSYN